MKKISMRDVAKTAGVSIATVSHVINGTKPVSPETKLRVENCIQSMGYALTESPPAYKKQNSTKLIGIIVPDISHSIFVSFYRSVGLELKRKGYETLLASSNEDLQQEIKYIRMFSGGIADGLLISSVASDFAKLQKHLPSGFPVAFFDRLPPGAPYDAVTINNYDAIYRGMEQLIFQNHSKIGCITSSMDFTSKNQRESAYRDAIQKYDLKEYYAYHNIPQAFDVFSGVKKLLQQGCTAIVSFNGSITEGIVNSLLKLDRKIGKDVEVLAFQDSAENEIYSLLSSLYIVQPISELVRCAAEQITSRIETPGLPIRQNTLMSYLISEGHQNMY